MAYATLQEFYRHGLRADAFSWAPRQVQVDVPASRFVLAGHGLVTGASVRFAALGAGGALPPELSPSALYSATRHASDVFSVGVVLSGAGTGPIGVVVDPEPDIVASLDAWSDWIDAHAAAYKGALLKRGVLTLLCSHLTAYDCAIVKGLANPQYQQSAEPLRLRAEQAQKLLGGHLLDGKPLAGGVVDQTPGVVEAGAIGFQGSDRGWGCGDAL